MIQRAECEVHERTKSKEKVVTDPKTNMASTLEKCPEMSQLMLRKGEGRKIQRTENVSFPEIDDFLRFQDTNNEGFSSGFDKKQRVTKRKGPQYRRINRYLKSTKQYWRERNRRKAAWNLSGEGYTYKQIAEKLGVSEKTVQRDIKKIRPYYYRLSRRYFRELEAERNRKLREELEGKTIFQQYEILSNKMDYHMKLMKTREYRRHVMNVTFDFDAFVTGEPPLVITPAVCSPIAKPFHIRFWLKSANNKRMIGSLQLSDVR